jgi:sarcosine oxidase subunit alpha
MGRSFKYHRPRGPIGRRLRGAQRAGRHAARPGRFEPNTRATVQELRDGLTAISQNRWPSAEIRRRRGQRCASPIFGRVLLQDLHVAEELLGQGLRALHPRVQRASASPTEPDPDHYASRNLRIATC